jgi:hypothetical protein
LLHGKAAEVPHPGVRRPDGGEVLEATAVPEILLPLEAHELLVVVLVDGSRSLQKYTRIEA